MSQKQSSIYQNSSFDAVESTRRLSEEISDGPSSLPNGHSPQGSTNASAIYKQKMPYSSNGEIEDAIDHVVKANNTNNFDNDNNNHDYNRRDKEKQKLSPLLDEDSTRADTPDASENALRFNVPKETSKKSNGDGSINSVRGNTSKSERAHEKMFDQRSESDSDLNSPDDFSDDEFSDRSNDLSKDQDQVSRIAKETNVSEVKTEQSISNCNPNESNQFSGLTDSSSLKDISGNGTTKAPMPIEDNKDQGNLDTSSAAYSTFQDISSLTKSEYAELTNEEIDNKLQDDEVIRQGELLNAVRRVGLTNLNKLQHLNWNDPTLRRLFMRPKITALEVKSVTVDPDIKNIVNEFLKTNVTENFVISRVLRENYALFYSWLASHLQTERNAWTTRLAQALEQAERGRKASLQTRNLMMEAAARLRMLVKSSSNILFGIPDKSDDMFFRADIHRRHSKNVRGLPIPANRRRMNRGYSTDGGYTSDSNASFSRRGVNNRYHKSTQGKKNNLVPSNYSLVKVTDKKHGMLHYDSDPGESFTESRFTNENNAQNESDLEQIHSAISGNTRVLNQSIDMVKRKFSDSNAENGNTGSGTFFTGYDLEGLILDDDKDTNWNQVLVDSVEVLTDICDTLLVDRKACFQILKANPKRCESLVEAVSTFVNNKHNEIDNKRDIEKRLRTLEAENRTLQNEMEILQKTLVDKNNDALNLQTQLGRLESMMKNQTASKINKCVGTSGEDMFPAVFKNNLTVGTNKTPRQGNHSQTNMHKHTKSPRLIDKENKAKTLELPLVNGMSNVKHPRQKREFHCPNPTGIVKEQEMKSSQDINAQTNMNISESPPPQSTTLVREPSLIEISEEKLKTLKLRAKKLEDSLHDAISSMKMLNTSAQPTTGSLPDSQCHFNSSIGPFYTSNKTNGRRHAPRTFRSWQKASFEVNSKESGKLGSDTSSASRVAVIKRCDSLPKQLDVKEIVVPDVRISLNSETSSLLEGRSIASATQDTADQTPAPSSLRMSSEKTHGLTIHSSRSNFEEYISDDDHSRCDYDGILTYRRQPDQADAIAASQSQGSNIRRLRARHNTSRMLGGKQTISKCLRCQKLFSPNDNHKLACCYHTKDKERLEQYDNSGMLIRVIHAWKCCNEPQGSEGCCYGQHV